MYTFTSILSTSTIGDSLLYVNNNYESLDNWTVSIQTSANNLWQPLVDLYNSHIDSWNQSLTFAQQNSAKWVSVATTVENLSSQWLTPLSLFYPHIYSTSQDLNTIKNDITKWLNQNFPVSVSYKNIPYYAEKQKIIVYSYSYYINKSINSTEFLIDQTTCNTANGISYVNCSNQYTGIAYCSNGNLNCNDYASNCGTTGSVSCYFNAPPYGPYIIGQGYRTVLVPVDPIISVDDDGNVTTTEQPPQQVQLYGALNDTGQSYIQVNLNTNFTDQTESKHINYFNFEVRDCQWVFISSFNNPVPVPKTESTYIILSENEEIISSESADTLVWFKK